MQITASMQSLWPIRPYDAVVDILQAQRVQALPWLATSFGAGIALYFALFYEPSLAMLGVTSLSVPTFLVLGWRTRGTWGGLLILLAVAIAGLNLASVRTATLWGPIVDWRYYGPVQGRVVGIDRSSSDKLRITLDQVRLARVAESDTPRRVRLSLHGDAEGQRPPPGAVIMTTAHLNAPPGPAEPEGFDFQRFSYFKQLGAVGYTRAPIVLWSLPEPDGFRLWVFQARMAISAAVRARIDGQPGAIAAAITTGDRSAMTTETYDALRFSNLAHLLAISGLHMGLLTGFVFGALRIGLSLIPRVGVHWPVKKIAALSAIVVGAVYLALAGGAIATERAFIMVSIFFLAVILDRRALTIRSVAIAAFVVLSLRPEALLSPGFQMSFAATTALVIVYGRISRHEMRRVPRRLKPVASVFISSFVGGLATAPIAALHFNMFAHYGLLANVLSVPLMGTAIMPAAVVAALAWPFGLEAVPLWVMEQGIGWILAVGTWVSHLPGAVSGVKSAPSGILGLLAVASIWFILWQGRARVLGLLIFAAGLALWAATPRPALLIERSGALVGAMTAEGRALSRPRGARFAADVWLENDGDAGDRERAASLWSNTIEVAGLRIRHVHGKQAVEALENCGGADWLILNHPAPRDLPCEVFDPPRLEYTGAIAVGGGRSPQIKLARDRIGQRPWNSAQRPPLLKLFAQ
ncbi:MAG: ComEC/Rec2 family competence protein [Pseudomonadota bacterium]